MLQASDLERLSRYLAHELGPEEHARLEAELSQSAPLRQALRRMEALSALADEEQDAGLDAAVDRAVRTAHPPARSRKLLGAAIAACVAALAAVFLLRGEASKPAGSSAPEYLQLIDGGEARALLGPHAELVQVAERAFRLERGTAMIEARSLHVAAGAIDLDLDGYAIVSMEPSVALRQVTLVTRSTHEGDDMRARLNDFLGRAPMVAATATVAVWMVSGEARATVNGREPATVRAGEVLAAPPPKTPAVVATATPKKPAAMPGEKPALQAAPEKCNDCVPALAITPGERTILEGNSPVRGPSVAPVTVVEFTDYECPFCRKASDTMLELEKLYGNKARFVFKQAPLTFHPHARLAAAAALAANEQGKFWEYRTLLFSSDTVPERQGLEEYAKQLKLDLPRFRAALDSAKVEQQIKDDFAEMTNNAAKDANGKPQYGTPLFFINGRPLVGAVPIENFVSIIDEELAAQEK
ncbi:MAG TPA: DsbA family protein [Myxococcales bacterium]|jgi:protein-disulfide isomerase|nr:DsbA family protein [Myxococcales bacterium]